jgi:hypothetical protein
VVVASPYGTTAFTASPLVWLLLIALAIYLMRR